MLTTPDVVRHFSNEDEHKERFVVFSSNDRRYFPRMICLRTVRYDNPFDEFLADLFESKLLYKLGERADDPKQAFLPMALPNMVGERLALQEALFLHQFCSSPAEVRNVCEQLEKGRYNYSFARQKELTEFIRSYRPLVRRVINPHYDPKMGSLAQIIKEAGSEKIVVFCEYLETARALRDGLKKLVPTLKIETTVDIQDLDDLLRRFAPIANEVLPEERLNKEQVQVLIATRSMSEGFNLQDASILVNYDLPWTVLQLAQRMGRVLRPWSEPRDVIIYNFVPSTMGHERIRHARNWESRLQERSRQHRSLAQIPVMVHRDSSQLSQEMEMEKLGREMFLAKDTSADLDLGQVMEFIQTVEDLTTSTFYNDLAIIPNQDEILKLPAGIRSAVNKPGRKRLFLLLRRGRNYVDTILADVHGNPIDRIRSRDEVMRAVRCFPETPKATFESFPGDDDFDAWIEKTRKHWAEKNALDPAKLQVICALALIPVPGGTTGS